MAACPWTGLCPPPFPSRSTATGVPNMPDELRMPSAATHDPALDALREVKVKLPADQVLRLHYARLKSGTNFSQTVSSALTRYFDELRSA